MKIIIMCVYMNGVDVFWVKWKYATYSVSTNKYSKYISK